MKMVNVHEAKTSLSKLLARVEAGEEVVIAKAGKPVAKLVGLSAPTKRRVPGLIPGLKLDDSFWNPLSEDELKAWEE